MSRAGDNRTSVAEDGFTLVEVLAVMAVLGMMVVALAASYQGRSSALEVKAATMLTASRLRDLRSAAIASGKDRLATIDVDGRLLRFDDGRAPVSIDRGVGIAVTAADSERRSPLTAGIRFFPNGSSTGATIKLSSERQTYEIRVNWLTGRVSTSVLH